MRPFQVSDQHAVYFLTLTIVDWIDVFTRKEYKIEVVESLNFCVERKGLEIFAWCLMSNHLHLLCRSKEVFRLSDTIQDFKKFTARKILASMERESIESRAAWILKTFKEKGANQNRITNYKFWVDGLHAVVIESNQFLEQKLHYIHQNPVGAMIVDEPEEYLFSSARDYAGRKGLVKVELY
ncbi:REP-associated tyrosine transposase [Algoriphagus chordae]|uniref:REP element-mobilizing transposase RayT n=1 Tax=Algoriphagus chordae TaxID=237019 RepID=A0A2W7QFZ9_9BACT|nr:transposase [Algoriphagus chordae]PZX47101.1 REP element-mobilizing transposase RayT [Algoriphagus chordae]